MKTAAKVWELGTTGDNWVSVCENNPLHIWILYVLFFSYLPLNLNNEPDGIMSWVTGRIALTYIYSIKQKLLEMFEDSSTFDIL